jgi:hypothetical protein
MVFITQPCFLECIDFINDTAYKVILGLSIYQANFFPCSKSYASIVNTKWTCNRKKHMMEPLFLESNIISKLTTYCKLKIEHWYISYSNIKRASGLLYACNTLKDSTTSNKNKIRQTTTFLSWEHRGSSRTLALPRRPCRRNA